jgi:hypothetical protein
MNVTISAVWIPWIVTALLLGWMLRPYQRSGDYDFGEIFRLGWLIPVLAAWVVYLAATR